MLIDSHCHIDHRRFDRDRADAWLRARKAGVMAQVVPAITATEWTRVKQTCSDHSGLHPAYGLHPMFWHQHREDDLQKLRRWIEQEAPVAVGECGLDFYMANPNKQRQLELFAAQLKLALEFNLPVIIHARRAVEEVINCLRRYPGLKGVLHSYSGSLQQAQHLMEMGFLLGFGGPVTYPNATRLHRLVAELPLQAILLESDAPDQPDSQHHNQRNEPAFLPLVLEQVSNIRGENSELVAANTTENAINLFGITV
ncbi:MAG: TatD family hydrolase [Gammaproteobacteria bacterium]|nr:TatD family hydrolase [Gammaproteobacteria bacterium]